MMEVKTNIKLSMDKLINFFNFEAIETPKFIEKRNQDWVSFGEDNLYPNLLLELYQTSAIHSTAINSKADAVKGEGLVNIGETIVNSKNETLNDIFAKLVLDQCIYGAFALNVRWARGGQKIAEIYHLPVKNVRSGKLNEDDEVMEYYYSNKWENTRKYKPKVYPSFNAIKTKGEYASQIYYAVNYSGGNETYNLPSYVGALNDIDLDSRISRYHNAQIQNGLSPSLWVNFPNGEPEESIQRRMFDDLNESYAGENNAGRLILTFSEDSNTAPQITPIQSTNDGLYTTLEERVTSRVLTAHRITSPLLVGIRTTGAGLGSNSEEIDTAFTHFMSTVIEPIQKLMKANLKPILTSFGINQPLEIIPSKMDWNKNNDEII